MSDCKFKVGDRVSNMGRRGKVMSTDGIKFYPLEVKYDDGGWDCFTIGGRVDTRHTRPSLKKLKKKKARYYPGVWQTIELKNSVSVMAFVPGVPYADLIDLEGKSAWLKDMGTKRPKGLEKPKGAE